MAQKAHKAMRLSLPPDVHDWLWERKRVTGDAMRDLAVAAIRECISAHRPVRASAEGSDNLGRKAPAVDTVSTRPRGAPADTTRLDVVSPTGNTGKITQPVKKVSTSPKGAPLSVHFAPVPKRAKRKRGKK